MDQIPHKFYGSGLNNYGIFLVNSMVNLWSIMVNNLNNNISGWWFGTWLNDMTSETVGNGKSSQLTNSRNIIFLEG